MAKKSASPKKSAARTTRTRKQSITPRLSDMLSLVCSMAPQWRLDLLIAGLVFIRQLDKQHLPEQEHMKRLEGYLTKNLDYAQKLATQGQSEEQVSLLLRQFLGIGDPMAAFEAAS